MKSGQLWVVKLSEIIAKRLHEIILRWPGADRRYVGDQLLRAADSIGANIVEGYGRHHVKDKARFYSIARGSLEETLLWVRKARDRGLLTSVEAYRLSDLLRRLSVSMTKFIGRSGE